MEKPPGQLNLGPFRRRIRALRVWRCAAIGGCAGAAVALALAALDLAGVRYASAVLLAAPIAAGVALGALKALTERLPDHTVALSVDRRGGMADRLTTAAEIPPDAGGMAGALHTDAAARSAALRAADLYPLRPGRWHGAAFVLSVVAVLMFALGNSPVFQPEARRKEAAELKQAAVKVERVTRPVMAQARRVDASQAEKDLARRLNKYTSDLQRGRMSKQAAMVRANQLSEEARRLERDRAAALAKSVEGARAEMAKLQRMASADLARTAGASLQRQNARAGMEKSESLRLAEQASSLESQIASLHQQMAAARAQAGQKGNNTLSREQLAQMEKRVQELQKQLERTRLSQRAQQFLDKLHADPNFQEAQELMQRLADNARMQQAGQPPEMTPEQMESAARRLEELARQYNSDARVRELAKQMLESAKHARANKNGQCSSALMAAMGLGGQGDGNKGKGGRGSDRWTGRKGHLSKKDKSSLLNVKFEDRVITSEIGAQGPQTYVEVLGPSTPGGKSSVPFQKVLPRYEKSAEAALNKSDIPPAERKKVRDYFDALRK